MAPSIISDLPDAEMAIIMGSEDSNEQEKGPLDTQIPADNGKLQPRVSI